MVCFSAKELIQSCFEDKKSFVLFSRAGAVHIAMLAGAQDFCFDARLSGWVSYPFAYPEEAPLLYPWSELISIDDIGEASPLEKPLLDWGSKTSSLSQADYTYRVEQAISHIRASDLDKVVLSRAVHFDVSSPLTYVQYFYLWRDFYQRYPKAFVYLWVSFESGEIWMGASPELFLSLDTKGCLETHSIAGTLSHSVGLDWTQKEHLEQDYVSRYIKSVLSNLQITDVRTFPLEEVYFGSLTHLASRIKAYGVRERDLPALIDQLFPTPAVCGFPKQSARRYISRVEGYDRSLYAGLIGLWGGQNICDFYANIRAVRFFKNRACFYVGGGILADSDPQKEWLETESKLSALTTGFS